MYPTSEKMISRFVLGAEEIYIAVVCIKPIACLHLFRSASVLKVLPKL